MEAEKSLHLQSGKPVFQFKFEGGGKLTIPVHRPPGRTDFPLPGGGQPP